MGTHVHFSIDAERTPAGKMSIQRINRLLLREDFRRWPIRALARRLIWRLRWLSAGDRWQLRLANGMDISAPRCGAGALIYYQGCTEPETARFIERFLKPGMTFFDVGAHIGEYALLGSQRVGPAGAVHAFEPQPDTCDVLRGNVAQNRLTNVIVHCLAVGASDCRVDFDVCMEPSHSSIHSGSGGSDERAVLRTISVPQRTLDSYCAAQGACPQLIKVDVEGAEASVLQGARALLAKSPQESPVWVLEYAPENYARLGHTLTEVIKLLRSHRYGLQELDPDGDAVPVSPSACKWDHTVNLVASKRSLKSG